VRRALPLVAAAVAVVAAPQALTRLPIRRRYLPSLAGIGDPQHVALTFDDGPDPVSTPPILDELARLGWRATFFMLGSMVERHPDVAAAVADAGHEVAVHGFSHRSHLVRRRTHLVDDVARATDAVALATGEDPRWFRPPYGSLAVGTLSASRRAGLQTVLWTAWGRDWRPDATPATVVADIEKGLQPGATVLLHDSDCTSAPGSWRTTVASLEPLGELFAARDLTVGPLADHGLREAAIW
jgi:peptidoglycan/xylan/chitin deacetylase (PgdA/CDA1 family)